MKRKYVLLKSKIFPIIKLSYILLFLKNQKHVYFIELLDYLFSLALVSKIKQEAPP